MSDADFSKCEQLFRVFMLMQTRKAGDARRLAEQLGVTERTVYRYLRCLGKVGIPFYLDPETGYRIRRDYFLPPISLTAGETLALMSLAEQVGGNEQIALTGPAARAVEKIRAQLPQRVHDELGDVDEHVVIRLPATGPDGEAIVDVFDTLKEAIRNRRAVRCRYESRNPSSDRDNLFEFRPYALTFEQRSWYVVGYHGGRDEVRCLKLNRFAAIELTDKPYAIPEDFSIETFRGKAWRMIRGDRVYSVAIHFDAEVAETVSDTHWHPTQEIEDHEDGSITFTCEVEGLDEIVWWVLGYGPHARVIQPPELVERVAELARATAARYFPTDH